MRRRTFRECPAATIFAHSSCSLDRVRGCSAPPGDEKFKGVGQGENIMEHHLESAAWKPVQELLLQHGSVSGRYSRRSGSPVECSDIIKTTAVVVVGVVLRKKGRSVLKKQSWANVSLLL